MRISPTFAIGTAALVAAAGLSVQGAASATDDPTGQANLSSYLVERLGVIGAGDREVVMVHGDTLQAAEDAVAATGMQHSFAFARIGVVGAIATEAQIQAVRGEPGVTYVEGNQPIEFFQDTSNVATRGY